MNKTQIVEVLENIGRLLELRGENPFKIRAYQNGARALETAPLSEHELQDVSRLNAIDGIGKAIAEKIAILAEKGELPYYHELREQFPANIMELFEVQGLGAKKIKALYEALGVASVDKLERVCRDGQVAALPGFGQKSAENFLKAIAQFRQGVGTFLYGRVAGIARKLLDDLRTHPEVILAQVAGSFRRHKEIVRDLDFLVSTREAAPVMDFFVKNPLVAEVLAHGATKSSVVLHSGIQCDLRAVRSEEYPFALAYFTGSKEHNVRIRGRCLEKGWTLNEYRFSVAEGRTPSEPLPEVREEADIYRALGLEFVPPELRENLGEIEAAAEGRLPRLIEVENLRGAFHNHTTSSDGRNTLEEMARAAHDLGLQYLGIADHSRSSVQANGLDIPRLEKQMADITALNRQLEDELVILTGTECDILKDGALDFPDEVLGRLDYVVASIHSSFQLDEAAMTKRIIRAMENPFVTMIGHLTGRLLLSREPYQVDIPAVLEAAAATGTVIELNANPRRSDLDWRWWPLAKSLGVRCAINPDAHSTEGLQDLALGIGIARKGWLTREDVINCLDLTGIREFLGRKRNPLPPSSAPSISSAEV
jgi:DNA polymerase (family 10)